jgi:hypothetical protein
LKVIEDGWRFIPEQECVATDQLKNVNDKLLKNANLHVETNIFGQGGLGPALMAVILYFSCVRYSNFVWNWFIFVEDVMLLTVSCQCCHDMRGGHVLCLCS